MHASFSKRKEYYVEFLSMFECPFTKSTSSSSFGNGMDIEISQKTKIWKKYFYSTFFLLKKKMTMPKTTRKAPFYDALLFSASFYSHILMFLGKIHKWTPCKIDYLNRMTINDCHHHILKDRISFFVSCNVGVC